MRDLTGLKVLVVEDEGPVALLIEDMLLDLGCKVVASAAQLSEACDLAATVEIEFALLDLNLDGESAIPVAHILRDRGITFVFSTGYGAGGVLQEFASYPILAKPFTLADLQQGILRALA
jgi:CheY-like chemotaxis protein